MSSTIDKLFEKNITILDKQEDYKTWKEEVLIILNSKDVEYVILEPDTTVVAKDIATAAKILAFTISTRLRKTYRPLLSKPAELWKKLEEAFDTQSEHNTTKAKMDLFSRKQKESESLEDYLAAIDNLRATLIDMSADDAPRDSDLRAVVLSGLNKKYHGIRDHFYMTDLSEKSYEEFCKDLRRYKAHEQLTPDNNDEHTDVTSSFSATHSRNQLKCFVCNKIGNHVARECRTLCENCETHTHRRIAADHKQTASRAEEKATNPHSAEARTEIKLQTMVAPNFLETNLTIAQETRKTIPTHI